MLANSVVSVQSHRSNIAPTSTIEIFKRVNTPENWISLGTYTIALAGELLGVHPDEIIAELNAGDGTGTIHNANGTYRLQYPPKSLTIITL